MTRSSVVRRAALLGAIIISVSRAAMAAATPKTLTLQPESTLWLVGDSTLHPFTSRATEFKAQAVLNQETLTAASGGDDIIESVLRRNGLKQLQVLVPVKGLKSKEASLDKNLYKALKADQHPEIVFILSSYAITPSTAAPSASHVKATGTLRITDREQTIVLEGEALAESSILRIQGEHALLMSDYGIKPPTMMLGAIKTRDRIVVHFDLRLQPAANKP